MSPLAILGLMVAVALGASVALFKRFYLPPEPPAPLTPHPTPAMPNTFPDARIQPPATLVAFCSAIRDYEGDAPNAKNPKGGLNYQLNNPGDCRPSSVGYLAKYQPVEIIDTNTDTRYLYHKGKFAKFPTYELGWEYLQALVHYRAELHPTWTLIDFFALYAPSSDANDPNSYAVWVAQRLGVASTITLQELLG